MKTRHSFCIDLALAILLSLVACRFAYAEDSTWNTQPVITSAYEQAPGKIYLEWTGTAPLYQLYLDGKQNQAVNVTSALIDVTRGNHQIKIVPVHKVDGSDFSFGVDGLSRLGLGINASFNSTEIEAGTPSQALTIDFLPDSLLSADAVDPVITMNQDNQVIVMFEDPYQADEYELAIRFGSDTRYIRFYAADSNEKPWIKVEDKQVTLCLTDDYLAENGCFALKQGQEYGIALQMRRYATNFLNGDTLANAYHTSKESREHVFKPVEAWTFAPEITMASQTADGQITLVWTHTAGKAKDCTYDVMAVNKTFGIKLSETLISNTSEMKAVINDLLDGEYYYTIVPRCGDTTGTASTERAVTVRNDWIRAPELSLTAINNVEVKLSWSPAAGVESYHIRVSKGDSGSILQYVNMDYQLYQEYDVVATEGDLSFDFIYTGDADPTKDLKLRFEIYGLRHAADGTEQTTATTTKEITLTP